MITIPTSGLWATIAGYLNLNFAKVPNAGSTDHIFKPDPHLALTNAWQVVQGNWVENVPSVGSSVDPATGVFTLTTIGRWRPTIERIYHQHDRAPSVPVMLHIKIQSSIDTINWIDTDFVRSSTISAATAIDEPAILSFNTDVTLDVVSVPIYFRILVMADEGGATPTETDLTLVKVTSNIIGHVPS